MTARKTKAPEPEMKFKTEIYLKSGVVVLVDLTDIELTPEEDNTSNILRAAWKSHGSRHLMYLDCKDIAAVVIEQVRA